MAKNRILCGRVLGGIGNQLFIYFFIRSVALRHNMVPMFDLKTGFMRDRYSRVPKLRSLVTTLKVANLKVIAIFYITKCLPRLAGSLLKSVILVEPTPRELFSISEKVLNNNKFIFVQGYFQSPEYFKDSSEIISKDISFNLIKDDIIMEFEKEIERSNSVSVHIRRAQYDNLLSLEYYINAINFLKSQERDLAFFIFSDDLAWCKNNFGFLEPKVFIKHNGKDELIDLFLISQCKHHIVANSSFSWWGAWLCKNENKLVIAPKNIHIGAKGAFYPSQWKLI